MKTQFELRLEILINQYSMENGSDTPDFILAEYLSNCLKNFDATLKQREEWYGRTPKLSDLPEAGEQIPIPIDLDNTNPIIDYDSTGNPPLDLGKIPTTGDKPDVMPIQTSQTNEDLSDDSSPMNSFGRDNYGE